MQSSQSRRRDLRGLATPSTLIYPRYTGPGNTALLVGYPGFPPRIGGGTLNPFTGDRSGECHPRGSSSGSQPIAWSLSRPSQENRSHGTSHVRPGPQASSKNGLVRVRMLPRVVDTSGNDPRVIYRGMWRTRGPARRAGGHTRLERRSGGSAPAYGAMYTESWGETLFVHWLSRHTPVFVFR